jgi:pimeloyl-ACP methyl ester carboxylesterase
MLHVLRRLPRFSRHSLLASALAAAAVIGVTASSAAAASVTSPARGGHNAVTCQSGIRIPVALAPGQPASDSISGELCSTWFERFPGSTVQLLIPGATYTRDYWDFGTVNGIRYDYARAVAARGFATFMIDPLGSGDSSHPLSTLITAQADAFVDHQVVQALRAGSIASIRFGKVIEVGHSLNSLIVWQEAITYHDVDGVIVTGVAHSLAAAFANSGGFYPAINDPKFANSGLDSGYLTTVPGTRSTLFYHLPDADPAVIALDEARKDVVSGTELNSALPLVTTDLTATQAIDVPVLDILGSNDFTTCGPSVTGGTFDCSSAAAVVAQEAPFYSPQAQLHACVIPGSGHDISLALNHRLQVADTVAWSEAFAGQRRPAPTSGHRGEHLPGNCA